MRYAQAVDVILRSLDIMMRAVTEYRLAMDKPEIIVRPQVADIETLSKVDVREVARRGETAVDEILPALKTLFGWRHRLARSFRFWN